MAKVGGLGRGLEALMGNAGSLVQSVTHADTKRLPKEVSVDDNGTLWLNPVLLKPNPHQPRKNFDEAALGELAQSVKAHGVLEPILCEYKDGEFFITAGERRTRAALLAGVDKVPIQLRNYDDAKRLEVALIENVQRENLNPIEEALAYSNLLALGGDNQESVAKRVGKSRATIANMVRLLKLPHSVQTQLASGQLSIGHAKVLLSISDGAVLEKAANKVISEKLTVRDTEKLVATLLGTQRSQNGEAATGESGNLNSLDEAAGSKDAGVLINGASTQGGTLQGALNGESLETGGLSDGANGENSNLNGADNGENSKTDGLNGSLSSENNGADNGSALNGAQKPYEKELQSVAERFIAALGTKVVVKGNGERGTIEVSYFSRADLDRIYGLITKEDKLG